MANKVDIRKIARDWWDFDIEPPTEYIALMWEYINSHPEEFKGLEPQ